jgi:outer membrane protein OmpA-like peptidoglycan-associated protein
MKRPSLIALIATVLSGCSLVTVQQEPFAPLQVTAKPPPPKPQRVVLTDSSIKISDKVQFKLGSAELLPESFPLLDEVVAVLKDNPQIEVIQVEGHTDSTGGAAINRKLSGERAGSVRTYLASKGVDEKRMVAKGFGPDKPIATNDTPEGQEQNRRVEFNILKQGPKKTLVDDDE